MTALDGDMARGTTTAWPEHRAAPAIVRVLRVVLFVLWAVWAGLAWWTAPRPVDDDQARRDSSDGQVVTFVRAEGWAGPSGLWVVPPNPRTSESGGLLVWSTRAGQLRYTGPTVARDPAGLVGASGQSSAPETERLADQLRAAQTGAGQPVVDHRLLGNVAIGLAAALGLIGLFILLTGPRPERGSRIFWFCVALLPYGVGFLTWLGLERPWSRRRDGDGDGGRPDATMDSPGS